MEDFQYSQRNEDGMFHCSYHTGQACGNTYQSVRRLKQHCLKRHNIIIKPTIRDTVNCIKSDKRTYICSEQFPNNCCLKYLNYFALLKPMH